MDTARDELMRNVPHSIPDFVKSWIKATIDQLTKNGQNPKFFMKEEDAIQLFKDTCVEGKGIPFLLGQIWGIPAELEQIIATTFQALFAPFPAVHFPAHSGARKDQEPQTPVDATQAALRDMESWFGP